MQQNRIGMMMSALFILPAGIAVADGGGFKSAEPAQIIGNSANTVGGWSVLPLVTVGEESASGEDVNLNAFGYRPIGILDGTGAFPLGNGLLRILVNHEVGGSQGYTYSLANGTQIRGARVSFFDIDTCTLRVVGAGPAYDTMYDRAGAIVTSATQINEGFGSALNGLDRLCGANAVLAGEYGFVNNCFFTGEEVGENGSTPQTGMGGQEAVIDVDNGIAYIAPMLARGAWESATFSGNFGTNKVIVPWGDDREGAPMWIYIGEKGAVPTEGSYSPPQFLTDNGMGFGYTYAWVSDNGDTTPQEFNGTGSSRTGRIVRVTNYNPALAGTPGWDGLGFASLANLTTQSNSVGGFRFSRPEDLHTNPADGTQFVFCSTGRGDLFPADNWGIIYLFDFDDAAFQAALEGDLAAIEEVACTVTILYDCNDAGGGQFAGPDFGIRNPDNCVWADDGFIYINEDRSTTPASLFGGTSGAEASVWRLDPATGAAARILEIDRTAVPFGQTDPNPADIGNWESSGVIDLTRFLDVPKGETVLLLDTQAHNLQSVAGVGLARNAAQGSDLVQGGQLLLASNGSSLVRSCPADFDCDGIIDGSDLGSLLSIWGSCQGCAADLNGDGAVDGADLGELLATWGDCG